MSRIPCAVVVVMAMAALGSPAVARRSHPLASYDFQSEAPVRRDDTPSNPAVRSVASFPNTTVLYSATFDTGGSCTDQGWTVVDLTAQLGDFFHVDDYVGLDPSSFAPLAGAKSLWCGARPQATGPLCRYLTLPGYGNSWDQAFCTKSCIPVSGDGILDVSFLARFDSEPSYDYTTIEYTTDCSGATGWTVIDGGRLPPTGWTGKLPSTNWLAGADYGGSYDIGTTGPVKVRLHFHSDQAWSDEDGLWDTNGALHVDNLKAEGLPVEDFEGEAVGATSSDDWESCTPPGYGNFASLANGVTALQLDPCVRDLSCLWTFLNGSTYNYGCGGHPEQLAVPFGNSKGQYLNNEIWSPPIPVTGSGSTINLEFSVYADLPLDNLVFYVWHVRPVTSCESPWKDANFVYHSDNAVWIRHRESIGQFFDFSTTSSIQVALGAVDMCHAWCGTIGSGACHTDAPLIDNVKVYRVETQGPVWSIRDIDQFQDNFADDGTLTGTVRADMANDILPGNDPDILPGDSASVHVADPAVGLGIDPGTGRAAVYCYVAVWPQGQANKTGNALTQNPSRWPVVGSWTDASGTSWTCIHTDSVIANGYSQPGYFCVDLNDNLFTPGDTVCFFYAAKNASGMETVAFGSNLDLVGNDREAAATNPSEFTCLPAGGHNRGGDILYVDGMDGRGAQPYWDLAFESLGISRYVDRYDVRGPSSAAANRPASRVKNVAQQLAGPYRVIMWDCGDLNVNIGDGSNLGHGVGSPRKTDGYQMLDDFLNQLQTQGGVYLSGDDVAERLVGYSSPSATTFRTTYLTFNLTASDARPLFGISPTGIPRTGGCYSDSFVIFGGCPLINDFDVMEPTGTTTMEVGYGTPATTNGAVIANQTINGNGVTVGAVMSGFSFIYLQDDDTDGISDRAKFLHDTLTWLADTAGGPTDAGPVFANSLSQNYPNPFNPTTTITYSARQRTHVRLLVYDVSGARVRVLADETVAAGTHTVKWDGRNDFGQPVASGVYFYQLISPVFSHTRKMVLLK